MATHRGTRFVKVSKSCASGARIIEHVCVEADVYSNLPDDAGGGAVEGVNGGSALGQSRTTVCTDAPVNVKIFAAKDARETRLEKELVSIWHVMFVVAVECCSQ